MTITAEGLAVVDFKPQFRKVDPALEVMGF
jgi:hypothetical protein